GGGADHPGTGPAAAARARRRVVVRPVVRRGVGRAADLVEPRAPARPWGSAVGDGTVVAKHAEGRVSKIAIETQSKQLGPVAPFDALLRLREQWGERGVALLESMAGPQRDVASSLIGFDPVLELTITSTEVRLRGREAVTRAVAEELCDAGVVTREGEALRLPSEDALWRVLRVVAASFEVPPGSADGFRFGFVGYLGYDVVRSVEQLPLRIPDPAGMPRAELTIYQGVVTFDLLAHTTELRVNHAPGFWGPVSLEDTAERLGQGAASPAGSAGDPATEPATEAPEV